MHARAYRTVTALGAMIALLASLLMPASVAMAYIADSDNTEYWASTGSDNWGTGASDVDYGYHDHGNWDFDYNNDGYYGFGGTYDWDNDGQYGEYGGDYGVVYEHEIVIEPQIIWDDSNYYNLSYNNDWGYNYYDDFYDGYYSHGYDDWGYDDYYYEDTTYVYEDYYYYDSCYYDPCGCDGCYDPCDNGGCDDNADRPDVDTLSAINIDEDSATLRCDVNPNNDDTDVWFEYGEDSGMDEDTSKRSVGDGDDEERVSRTIYGLDEDEKYYFRCVAENDEGRTYGDTKTFYTDDDNDGDRPDVTTLTATDITSDSARLRCEVEPNGTDTEVWFEYGETTSMREDTYHRFVDGDDRSENIDKIITNLDSRTIYYYRCVAENDDGTTYGSMKNFDTGNGGYTDGRAPDAITNAAFNIGRTSARFVGTASMPSAARSVAWFEWGTSPSLGRTSASQSIGSGPSALVEHSQFSLAYNTTYYYRLVVQNTYGIDRGNIVSFTTLGAPLGPTPEPKPEPKEYDVRIIKTVENLDAENGTDTDILGERGHTVRYTIDVENTGDYTLSETEISDLVPFYLEFANAEDQLAHDDPQREVVWFIGDLRPGETERVTLDMIVTDDARTGMTIENIARVESEEHAESSNSVYIRVTDDVLSDSRYDRAAAGLFLGSGGFFPTTFVGWLFLAILLLILVILVRTIVGYYDEHKAKKAAAAGPGSA